MIKDLRKKYNSDFSEIVYNNFMTELYQTLGSKVEFRISESPLFLDSEITSELQVACEDILSQLKKPEYSEYSNSALPKEFIVPNEINHPVFLQIDFAITKDHNGKYKPQLIELQGFPSLYGFKYYFQKIMRSHFDIPSEMTPFFNGISENEYAQMFKNVLLGNSAPENVVLLEIEPLRQKTLVDFSATEKLTGVAPVCISDVIKKGKKLFYKKNGVDIPIDRIYNRVIYDELIRTKIDYDFKFTDDLDVHWVGHPNWFFKISKFTIPFLNSKYVPDCGFLGDYDEYPDDLENYVLKPLFSFAGLGVEIDIDEEKLDLIKDPENYILQKKIEYAPLVETPDGFSKCEIRMMYLWEDNPLLVNNLVRMSKGKMMGVDFNKNKTWVGSSCGFHF